MQWLALTSKLIRVHVKVFRVQKKTCAGNDGEPFDLLQVVRRRKKTAVQSNR